MLVNVEFEGNEEEDLNDKVLKAQIVSKPTDRPTVRRIFSIFAQIYDANPFMPQYMRDEMHSIVDSLAGDIRYLNPRLLVEDTTELRRIYDQFGYHEVELDYRIVIDTARNRSIIKFIIDEGHRYDNHGVTYFGLEEVPEDVTERFREPVAFEIGDDYRTEDVINESGRAIAELQNNGYPFAARTAMVTISRNDSAAGVRSDSTLVSIYTGNRYRFGGTTYLPDTISEGPPMREWVVRRQLEYEPGEYYNRQKVDQTISNLYGLGVYEYVRVDSLSSTTTDSTLGMQLITKLQDPRVWLATPEVSLEKYVRDYYAFAGLSSTFSHANLFGGAEKLTLLARARAPIANLRQSKLYSYGATVSYLDQTLIGRRWSLQGTVGYDHAIEDRIIEEVRTGDEVVEAIFPLSSDRLFGSFDVSYRFPSHTWISSATGRLTAQYLRYSFVRDYILKKAEVRVNDAVNAGTIPDSLRAEATAQVNEAMINHIFREQVWLGDSRDSAFVNNDLVLENFDALKRSVVLSGSATGDDRDHFFSPRNGYFTEFRGELGTNWAVSWWAKAEGEYRFFKPLDDEKTFGFKGHAGAIIPFGPIKLVPLTSRFWSGGSNSLRGWGPREMLVTRAPTDVDSTMAGFKVVREVLRDGRRLLGGLIVLEAMSDLRWRPFNFPASSTLLQQINQLMLIVGLDAGGAFFRDYDEDGATFAKIVENIGISPSVAFGYDTPIGPLRIGFGWAVRDPINYPEQPWLWERTIQMRDWAWFFSIGHAF